MSFAHPFLLSLLVLPPVLAWLKGKRGQDSAFLYSSVQLVKPIAGLARSRAGKILLHLRWLALALFIIALAQPRWVTSETVAHASGIDIAVALDLSGSMASEDFILNKQRTSRITVAKDVLKEFIGHRPNDRIGLVAFAGRSYIASPMTLDHDFLLQNLKRVNLEIFQRDPGTAIGAALGTALNRLRDLKAKSKIVILMTDGQENINKIRPLTSAEAAHALGVKVYTIGVGIRGRAPMPYMVAGQKRYSMEEVDIDEDTLTKIANMTGGKYFRADSTDTLRKIYAEIDRLEKTEIEVRKYRQYDELFPWSLLGGLTFLLLEIILGQTIWRKLP